MSRLGLRLRKVSLILLAFVLALPVALTAISTAAQAQGSIRVSYVEANPRTGHIEGSSCTGLPSGDQYIDGLSDTSWSGAQGNCSFIAAHYSRDGIDLIIRELKVEGDSITVVPEVSAKQQAEQNHVKLSISIKDLEAAAKELGSSPIKLYYGDSEQFRRIALSLDSNMAAASGNSQPDINVDGTQMTGTRLLYLFRETLPDGSVAYVRNISVDVPRLWQIKMYETTNPKTNQITFEKTNDNSDVNRTIQQFDVIYKGSANSIVNAEVTASKFDTVKMHATTYANIWDTGHMPKLDKHGVHVYTYDNNGKAIDWDSETGYYKTQSPYNAGGGYAQGRYYDGALLPFFYKVMSTTGDTMVKDGKGVFASPEADKKYRGEVFRRTGIPVRARSSDMSTWPMHWFANGHKCHDGACSWLNMHSWNKGENWDNTWHKAVSNHLLSASIDAPKPVTNRDSPNSYFMTDWQVVDVQDTADPEWPIVENVKWEDSKTPLEQNAAGQDSYVSFYVQFNGIENTPLRNDNYDNWSYFLGRVRVNGQWISVPFPNIPKKPLGPYLSSTGCFIPLVPADGNQGKFWDGTNRPYGWNLDDMQYPDGKFHSTCESDYTKARERIFTPLGAKNPGRTVKTVTGDMFDTDDGRNYVYSVIGLSAEQISEIDKNISSGRQLQETYDPVVLLDDKDGVTGSDKTVSFGENAGMKVKVELVNARSQGDLLADGFSSFTSSGNKTVSRANRHTPSPRVGPAVQMTNISTSDRSKLDWDMDRDQDDNGKVSEGNLPENQRSARRSGAQSNQWKTLYKVTITGMMTPKVDVHFQYDYTSKPKFWNAGSDPAKYVQVKEMQGARGGGETEYTHTPAWRDRSTEGGIEEEAVCKRNNKNADGWVATDDAGYAKCDASIASDMAIADELAEGEGNLKFELKDGFIKPRLTTAYNRLQTDYCIDPESGITADGAHGTYKTKNTTGACEKRSHKGALWQFRWNYKNEEPIGWNRDSTGSGKVRTNTSTSFRVDADAVRLPAIMMTGSTSDATASKAVSEQWSGDTLTPQKVDKESNYFMKVLGNIPEPITVDEDGKKVRKAFTGYQLYAVNCQDPKDCTAASSKTQLTRMYADRVFYPGDAIDLRAVNEQGEPVIRLSNDTYLGQRYDAFWFVPTYGTPLDASLKLYTGQKYLGTSKNAEGEWEYEPYQDDFNFYAAPGLTATAADTASDTEGAYLPKSIKLNNITYTYREDLSDTAKAVTKDADEVLAFRYLPPEIAYLRVNLTWTFLDGANNDAVMEGVVPTQGGVDAWLHLEGGPTRPAETPDATKNNTYTWNTYHGYSEGDRVLVSYDYKVNKLVAPGCELTPVRGTWKRVDKGKETAEETFLDRDAVVSKMSEKFKAPTLQVGANTYEAHITARCEQSITVYSEGDHQALSDSGYPMPAEGENDPEHLKPVAGGPEDFTRATAGEKRSSILNAIGGSWKPFHATVTNGILDPHTEPTIESGSKADRHFNFSGVLYRNGEATSTTVPVGVREPAWMQAGEWAPQLPNHGEWVYNYVCPLSRGAKINDDTSLLLAGLEPGQNVVCYVGFHTSEVTVLADVPNGNESNFSALIDEYHDGVTGGRVPRDIDGLGTSVTKATTTRFSPGSPLGLSIGMKTGSTSDYLAPEYYLYTGDNANQATTSSTQWKKLATADEVKRWYPNAATSIKEGTLYELGSEENTVATVKNGVPVAYTPAEDTHVVLKAVLTPVVRPSLPLTGGLPADYILLAGLAILAGGGAIAAYTIKRRKSQA